MSVKAVQATGVNKVEMVEFPLPKVAEDAILLKNLYCGVCGTDLHGIEGKREIKFPIIPGHELVAQVAEIGPKALERTRVFGGTDLKIGDKVTINPRIVCGKCYYCQNLPQKPQLCLNAKTYNSSLRSNEPPYLFGGWAEYIYIIPGSEIIKLPNGIDLEVASLIEPLACSVGLIDRYTSSHDLIAGDGFRINRNVVIFGVGAIGALAAACFHLKGAEKIICIDAMEEKLELVKKLGADITINVNKTSPEERVSIVKNACDGIGASIVVEACGVPETITEGVQMLRRGGTLFEIGHLLKSRPSSIDPNKICRDEISIAGNYAYPSSNCLAYAAKILMEEDLPFRELIKTYPLKDYEKVLFGKSAAAAIKNVFKI